MGARYANAGEYKKVAISGLSESRHPLAISTRHLLFGNHGWLVRRQGKFGESCCSSSDRCWSRRGFVALVRASLVDGVNLDVDISIYTSIYTLLKYTPLSFSVERVNLDVYIPTAIFSNGYIFNGRISSLYKPPLPSLF